jgi:alpha-beta hydrolase superfamily lysophospholipase
LTAEPLWFGPADRPLFGWFHMPEGGAARAGVVVCPPIAREYLHAHYACRRLARQLEARGIAVLRFDYDGTGDSGGLSDDPGRVRAWLASVHQAISLVRAAGCTSVGLVGMRLGATLAAVAAHEDGDVDALVLWDPCVSGRGYVREQRALATLTLAPTAPRADGAVEIPGLLLSAETVRDLGRLDLPALSAPLARRLLILTRPDRPKDRGTLGSLPAASVEFADAPDQSELMDVGSPYQVLPQASIDRITDWLDGSVPAAALQLTPPATGGAVDVGIDQTGGPLTERPLNLGPHGLFGIATEPTTKAGTPTLVFLSVANEHHAGPGRLWVELARSWAAVGVRCVRFDLSGLGDSPARTGQPEFVPRAPEAFDDVVDATRAVSPHDPGDVVLIGLCSSAYQAIDSALELRPRAVLAINPVLSFQPPEMLAGLPVDPRRQVALPRTALVEAFHDEGPMAWLRKRFPDAGWKVRTLLARRTRPERWLRRLERDGVDLLLVCGDREVRPIRQGTSSRTFAELLESGRLRHIPGLDHGLLVADHREQITAILADRVMRLIPGDRGEAVGAGGNGHRG